MVADASSGFNPYAQPNPYGPPPGSPPAPYGPPPGGYGTPGQPGGYGTPGQPGGYGTPGQPPAGYGTPGQPPAGYGTPGQPPAGYGAPAQPQYGGAQPPGGGYGAAAQPQYAPPGGGYGAPGGGGYGAPGGFTPPQDPYGMSGGAPLVPTGGGQRGPIGTIRNPVMTIVIGMVCGIYAIIQLWKMLNELKAFRGKDDINPIMFFLPIMSIIEGLKLSEVVLDAKRMAGIPNPQVPNQIVYLFFGFFFLPGDLNEIWQAAGGGQLPPG
jgi:hypothetical protein